MIEIVINDYNKISVVKSTCKPDELEYIKEELIYSEDSKYIHATIDNLGPFLYHLSIMNEIRII